MRAFELPFALLLAATIACGDSGGATTADGTGTTSAAATDTTTSEPSTGGTTSSATTDATDGSATADATSTTTTTTTTTSATTTSTTGDTTGAPSTSTTDDATTGTTGDTTTTTGDTTGDTDGTSPLIIAIVDAELWADCMPVIPPDPVQGSWYVEFDNTNNPADTEAVVTGAWLSPSGGEPKSEPILVDPVASGPIKAGDYVSIKLEKLVGQPHSACGHCGEFYDLVLEYDEGGITHEVKEDVTISCAF